MVVAGGSVVVTGGSVVVTGGAVVVTGGAVVVTAGWVVVTGGSVAGTGGSAVVAGAACAHAIDAPIPNAIARTIDAATAAARRDRWLTELPFRSRGDGPRAPERGRIILGGGVPRSFSCPGVDLVSRAAHEESR